MRFESFSWSACAPLLMKINVKISLDCHCFASKALQAQGSIAIEYWYLSTFTSTAIDLAVSVRYSNEGKLDAMCVVQVDYTLLMGSSRFFNDE